MAAYAQVYSPSKTNAVYNMLIYQIGIGISLESPTLVEDPPLTKRYGTYQFF